MYWRRIGWAARKLEDWVEVLSVTFVEFQVVALVELVPLRLGGKGGGGDVGRGGEDGVAFSIRAHVR